MFILKIGCNNMSLKQNGIPLDKYLKKNQCNYNLKLLNFNQWYSMISYQSHRRLNN